jgi:hypothetical protein
LFLTQALGEVVVPLGAAVAVLPGKVFLARALAAADLAHGPGRPVGEAVARLAVRVVVVARAAGVAVRCLVLLPALALARPLPAVARRVEHVAVATCGA